MTPEREILIAYACPTWADFERYGPIIHYRLILKPSPVGPVYETLRYELKMFLDPRRYEIHCEGLIVKADTY